MIHLLNIVRIKNLLLIVLIQLLIKFALFVPFGIPSSLPILQYVLLITASVFITAAGYIINDINDTHADTINKPKKVIVGKKISEKTAYTYYFILNISGVLIGFYLSNFIQKPSLTGLFIGISAVLYLYATYLKSIVILKNVLVSILAAMVIIIPGIFDLMPSLTNFNRVELSTVFSILLDYALFAFLITCIREIIKDIEDVDGDKNMGIDTIPILIGNARAAKISFAIALLTVFLVVYYLYHYLYSQTWLMSYFLFFVIAPLLYFCIKVISAKSKKDFSRLSAILKWVMFLGISSLALYPFVLLKLQ